MSNPVKAVYDKLWDVLEAHAPFTDLFPEGNRRRYRTQVEVTDAYSQGAEKEGRMPADYPEIIMVPDSRSRPPQIISSSAYFWQHRINIRVLVGDKGVDKLTNIQWAIIEPILAARDDIKNLLWEGREIVQDFSLVETESVLGPTNIDESNQWDDVLTIDVRLGLDKKMFEGVISG